MGRVSEEDRWSTIGDLENEAGLPTIRKSMILVTTFPQTMHAIFCGKVINRVSGTNNTMSFIFNYDNKQQTQCVERTVFRISDCVFEMHSKLPCWSASLVSQLLISACIALILTLVEGSTSCIRSPGPHSDSIWKELVQNKKISEYRSGVFGLF